MERAARTKEAILLSFRPPRAVPSVTRLQGRALWPDSLHPLGGGAQFLPKEGRAWFPFSFHGKKSQLKLGPLLLESITRRGSGNFQPAPRAPGALLAQEVLGCWWVPFSGPWLPGSGATSQRPGIRKWKGKVIRLPPESVLSGLDLTQVPSSFCPLKEQVVPHSTPRSQPASPAPGQMHGLRIDLTCDLEAVLQAEKGWEIRAPLPTGAHVSSSV